MAKVKTAFELLTQRLRNSDAPKRLTQSDMANNRAVKIITHNCKVAFSALIATQVGDRANHLERAARFMEYWDDCVRQAVLQLRERFPDKQAISDGELGMLRMAVRPLANDGIRAGITPHDAIARALDLPWAEDLQNEFEPNALPADTELVMMNTATGVNRLYSALNAQVMRHDLDADSKAVMFGRNRSAKEAVLDVFLACRDAAAHMGRHVVENLGGSEAVLAPATVAAFTSTYINHVKELMETSFALLLKDVEAAWGDPVRQQEMLQKGALTVWLTHQINDFSHICLTVFDSAPNLSATDGYITARDLHDREEAFERGAHALSKNISSQATVPAPEPEQPDKPEEPNDAEEASIGRRNETFAELLARIKAAAPGKPNQPAGQP